MIRAPGARILCREAHARQHQESVKKQCAWLQGSVEERIMEIIKQRKAGQQAGSGQAAEEEALPRHRSKGKVRAQQDVAGSLKTDRQILRTAELEQLFKVCILPQGLPDSGGIRAVPERFLLVLMLWTLLCKGCRYCNAPALLLNCAFVK